MRDRVQPTLANVRAAAKAHGATMRVVDEGDCYEVLIDAPGSSVWADSDVHELVGALGYFEPRRDMYADLLARMAGGLRECPVTGCERCAT